MSDRSAELRRLAPKLSHDMASHLVSDDEEQFEQFVARKNSFELFEAFWWLVKAPPTDSLPEFVRVERLMDPYERRLIQAMALPNRLNLARVFHEAYLGHAAEDRIEIIRLEKEIYDFEKDPTALETRSAELLPLIDRWKKYADVLSGAHLYDHYALLLQRLGRVDEMPHCYQLGIEAALAYPDSEMACQLLGTLGTQYQRIGDIEAMRRSWDRALALARACGSRQEVRILLFYSDYYRSRGQLAIARDLALEALERCSKLKAVETQLRSTLDALQFFAKLECWDYVGRGLRSAEVIYGESRPHLSPADANLEGTRLQVLRARYFAETGQCEEAQDLAREVARHVRRWRLGPARSARVRLDAARALETCGCTTEARELLEQGLEQCIETPVPALVEEYAIELAEVSLALGEVDACQKTLDAYPDTAASRESVRQGVLQLRLAMWRNDRPTAFEALQAALRRLDKLERGLGASPEAYMALAATDELRRLGHVLLHDSPELGYAFEMRWRRPGALGPRFSGPVTSEAYFASSLAAESERAVSRLAARDAVHCVYDVREDEVVRFTANGGGVLEERLACSPDALRKLVEKVCAPLGDLSSRSDAFDAKQAEDLRQLATWLLPESLRRQTDPQLFLVTANDFLTQLRFETLNVGGQEYVPLLDRVDVASMRHWGGEGRAPGDLALVVSDPVYLVSLRRRYSILTEALPVSAIEAACAKSLLPRSVGLAGPDATQRNVVERWERARVLYFAGHSVQDPELPYVMFIPLAEPFPNSESYPLEVPRGREDDSYLEVADVRNADLSSCQLVVLSSCASGAPYLNGKVSLPSLADVFLDAGARAVVSTGWTIRDDAAAQVMTSFLHHYAADESDPVAALCRARRDVASVTKDPHIWAAYSITLGGLPDVRLGGQRAAAKSTDGGNEP